MKNKITIMLACSSLFLFGGCGGGGGEDPKPSEKGGEGAYPLTVCVVSGEELGSMGKPVEYDHEGTLVKFCCKSCIPKFEKEPEKYLAKLESKSP